MGTSPSSYIQVPPPWGIYGRINEQDGFPGSEAYDKNFASDPDFWVEICVRSRFLGVNLEQILDNGMILRTAFDPVLVKFSSWGQF